MKRWQLLLNEYNHELKSIVGKENLIADELSRCFLTSTENREKELFFKKVDEYIVKKSNHENIIYKDIRETWKLHARGRAIINPSRSTEFIEYIHIYGSHTGILTTYYY